MRLIRVLAEDERAGPRDCNQLDRVLSRSAARMGVESRSAAPSIPETEAGREISSRAAVASRTSALRARELFVYIEPRGCSFLFLCLPPGSPAPPSSVSLPRDRVSPTSTPPAPAPAPPPPGVPFRVNLRHVRPHRGNPPARFLSLSPPAPPVCRNLASS